MATQDLTAAVERVLRESGLTDHPDQNTSSDIHGWRCSYPDRYGECDCFQDLRDSLVAVLDADIVRRSG